VGLSSVRNLNLGMFWLTSHVAYWTGLTFFALSLEKALSKSHIAIVVIYHRITDGDEFPTPLSELQRGDSVEVFERQIKCVRRWFRPSTIGELIGFVDGKDPVDSDLFVVTFDDGYRDNLTIAAPILMRLSVPAVVFLATAFIDTSNRFWWVRLTDLLQTVSPVHWDRIRAEVDWPKGLQPLVDSLTVGTWDDRRQSRRVLGKAFFRLELDQTVRLLDELEALTGTRGEAGMPMLTWKEVEEILEKGFDVGGHTENHPLLTRVSPDVVVEEVEKCLSVIESKVHVKPVSFAYPAGDHADEVVRLLEQSNFQVSFTARPGTISPGSPDRHALPRLYLSVESRPEILAMVLLLKLSKHVPSVILPLLRKSLGDFALV